MKKGKKVGPSNPFARQSQQSAEKLAKRIKKAEGKFAAGKGM